MNHTFKTISSIILLMLFSNLFTGCSLKEISSNGITPKNFVSNNMHNSTISIKVDGGRKEDSLRIPEISNEILLDAVSDSIKNSKLFKNIIVFDKVVKDTADYKLELFIVNVEQPVTGFDITVSVEIAWILSDIDSGNIVFKESIISSSTKTRHDESNGRNRIVVATEVATRKNIFEALELISKLALN